MSLIGGTTGNDTFSLPFTTNRTVSYYADQTSGGGGNVEVANTFRMSFENLNLLSFDGNNGIFLADSTLAPASGFTIGDNPTPGDGLSRITANGAFTNADFGGFNLVTVRGGTGTQQLSLDALDALDAALQGMTLSGDNAFGNDPAPDALLANVVPPNLQLVLIGGAGDDVFQTVPGQVTAVGDSGANRLVVDGSAIATPQNVTVTSLNINGGGSYNVFYQSVGGNFANGILLITGNGADNVTVNSTAAPMGVATTGGDDVVTVAGAGPLQTLLATTLTVDGGEGINTLTVNNSPNTVGQFFDIDRSYVAGVGWRVNYGATGGSFGLLTAIAGTGNDVVRVIGVSATRTVARAITGNDTIRVFVGNNNLPRGLEVDGGLGTNTLQTFDTTGGGIIRNFPTGPRSGVIQVSYQLNVQVAYQYRNIDQVIGINPSANYVTSLFRHILGRNPASAAEINNWINAINAQGRLPVVRALETSPEGRTNLVRRWYQMFFGRNPTPAESAPLVNALLAGQSEEQVLGTLLGSPALPLTPAFRTQMVNSYYQDLLRRAPTAAELSAAVSGGQPLQSIREGIEISNEYFQIGL
jgi:hypothetical protein